MAWCLPEITASGAGGGVHGKVSGQRSRLDRWWRRWGGWREYEELRSVVELMGSGEGKSKLRPVVESMGRDDGGGAAKDRWWSR
jgi:hypothetical protein